MENINWVIDPTHSEISFKVKHLVISTVTGFFRKFEGLVQCSNCIIENNCDNFNNSVVKFSANIDSIDTGIADRDGHLKSADFFDATNHPTLSFEGKIVSNQLVGNLTIKGVTNEVTLDVDFGGVASDPYGQVKAGFELEGKISRKDFGLTWSAVTEAGSVVVSDSVKLVISVQVVKQA